MLRRLVFALLALSAVACKTTAPANSAPATAAAPAPAPAATKPVPPGLSVDIIDPAVSPCDDFYQYACGNWLKKTDIPADRSRWTRGFDIITAHNEELLHAMLEQIAAGKAPAGDYPADKLGAVYQGCMDQPQHDAALPTAQKDLKKTLKVESPKALATTLANLQNEGGPGVFAFGSDQDDDNATQMMAAVDQSGLGMPDRDYYLSDDAKKKDIRAAYLKHVEAMLTLYGEKPEQAKADAQAVLDLETELAKASLDKVSRRNPHNMKHHLTKAELAKQAPGFPWDVYFKQVKAPTFTTLNVTVPAFFTEVGKLTKSTKPKVWTAYLTYHSLEARQLALPQNMQDEHFAFAQKLSGQATDTPRWKKCVRLTDRYMGEALGVPFVMQNFGADGKAKALEMVKAIEASFESNLDTLDWMDVATRQEALKKIRAIINKIGYPDKWRDYGPVTADAKDFFHTDVSLTSFREQYEAQKIGKPTDRTEWLMTPPTVNAYFEPHTNEVAFPAGILQPPFFSKDATAPVNFGSIGMVVGHEFTHGFDDQGRQFDAGGNLKDWWSKQSGDAFVSKVACVKRQFDGYVAVDDVHLNGGLTLGENVADLGGLKLAHAALQKYLAAHATEVAPDAYRFTPDQQFFLGYAQAWCGKTRPEEARNRVVTDPHSPPNWRVNGPLSNMLSFKKAFQCADGSKMTRPTPEICQVW